MLAKILLELNRQTEIGKTAFKRGGGELVDTKFKKKQRVLQNNTTTFWRQGRFGHNGSHLLHWKYYFDCDKKIYFDWFVTCDSLIGVFVEEVFRHVMPVDEALEDDMPRCDGHWLCEGFAPQYQLLCKNYFKTCTSLLLTQQPNFANNRIII